MFPEKYAEVVKSKLVFLNLYKPAAGGMRFYFSADAELSNSEIYSIIYEPEKGGVIGTIGPDFVNEALVTNAVGRYANINLVDASQNIKIWGMPIASLDIQNSSAFPYQRLANKKFRLRLKWDSCFVQFNDPDFTNAENPSYLTLNVFYKPL